jgi:hypothetical protein
MTAEYLSAITGVALSLAFAYIPGLKDAYDAQTSQGKARIMAIALIVVAGGLFGLACANIANLFDVAIVCDVPGLVSVVKALLAALVANQAAYLLLVRPFKK